MTAHTCHAIDCTRIVPEKMLMRKRHWFMVPHNLRDRVWETFRPGQEIDKNPSEEWHQAADAAIAAVANLEAP